MCAWMVGCAGIDTQGNEVESKCAACVGTSIRRLRLEELCLNVCLESEPGIVDGEMSVIPRCRSITSDCLDTWIASAKECTKG